MKPNRNLSYIYRGEDGNFHEFLIDEKIYTAVKAGIKFKISDLLRGKQIQGNYLHDGEWHVKVGVCDGSEEDTERAKNYIIKQMAVTICKMMVENGVCIEEW